MALYDTRLQDRQPMSLQSAQEGAGPLPSPVPGQRGNGAETTSAAERDRLSALDDLDVLDTPPEEAFDRITRLTKKLFGVPVAYVSFVDGHRQWFKSREGLTSAEGAREHAFCRHVVEGGEPLIVTDAANDPRFAQNPYVVGDPKLRFYAGMPLRTGEGHNVGSLCIVDTRPRAFDAAQAEILSELSQMVMGEIELRLCASVDALTGAASRRGFKDEAARAVALALRHHQQLSVVTFDIDHFKNVNDTHGHPAGDRVLSSTVKACMDRLRTSDMIGRLGGEEFAVLLPNTDSKGASRVAETLRAAIEGLSIDLGTRTIGVTASFGVAGLDTATRDVEGLMKNADAALYEAKTAGRNRCVTFRSSDAAAAPPRRRVFKGGHILFNGRSSIIDCTVRSLDEHGAGLDVFSSTGVPRLFDLAIRADEFERPCRLVSATEKHIEVEFR